MCNYVGPTWNQRHFYALSVTLDLTLPQLLVQNINHACSIFIGIRIGLRSSLSCHCTIEFGLNIISHNFVNPLQALGCGGVDKKNGLGTDTLVKCVPPQNGVKSM